MNWIMKYNMNNKNLRIFWKQKEKTIYYELKILKSYIFNNKLKHIILSLMKLITKIKLNELFISLIEDSRLVFRFSFCYVYIYVNSFFLDFY